MEERQMTDRKAKIRETNSTAKKKFVWHKEGAGLYSMGLSKFQQIPQEKAASQCCFRNSPDIISSIPLRPVSRPQ